ncbi:MAG: choice-of-anchor Q domain-containing protein [Anaerolineales bacterium]
MSVKTLIRLILLASLAVGVTGLIHPSLPVRADTGATIQVNTTDDELNNDSDCSLREAIRAANLNVAVDACTAGSGSDTILIPAGTYKLSRVGGDDSGVNGDLDISQSVTLEGVSNTTTIIDANGNVTSDRAFDVQSGVNATLTKMTIRGGKDNGFNGGGIRNQGTLILSKVLFIANSSSASGGGLYNTSTGKVTLNTVSFGNNQAYNGGAVYNAGELHAIESALTFDQAIGGNGGGLFNNSGDVTLNKVTIAQETAGLNGGGIYNLGNLTITYSTIQDNMATSGDGGGIYGGWITVTHSTIYQNQSPSGNGGGIYHLYYMSLSNVTLSANSALKNGGGIYAKSDYPSTVTNTSLLGNTAASGSGVFRDDSQVGALQLRNTLLLNAAGNCGGMITSLGHNIDSGTTCGFNQSGDQNSTDPLTEALADNGGPTQTHALQSGSPAINGGDNTGCPATDQRGFLRLGGCDIGAYEYLKWVYMPFVRKSP